MGRVRVWRLLRWRSRGCARAREGCPERAGRARRSWLRDSGQSKGRRAGRPTSSPCNGHSPETAHFAQAHTAGLPSLTPITDAARRVACSQAGAGLSSHPGSCDGRSVTRSFGRRRRALSAPLPPRSFARLTCFYLSRLVVDARLPTIMVFPTEGAGVSPRARTRRPVCEDHPAPSGRRTCPSVCTNAVAQAARRRALWSSNGPCWAGASPNLEATADVARASPPSPPSRFDPSSCPLSPQSPTGRLRRLPPRST